MLQHKDIIIEERHRKNDKTGKREKVMYRYQKGALLGKGGFAKCYHITNLDTKQEYAAKIIEKATLKPKTKEKLNTEIKIHSGLKNKNVVHFQSYFEDINNVYIILELCSCNVRYYKLIPVNDGSNKTKKEIYKR